MTHSPSKEDLSEVNAYKTLRRFPELRQSLQGIHELAATSNKGFKPPPVILERTIQTKSTHGLEQLTKTSIGEFDALNQFRKTLIADRQVMRERMKRESSSASCTTFRKPKKRMLTPVESVIEKLTVASLSFDSGAAVNVLSAFSDYKEFRKDDLQVQMKRSLNVCLNAEEMNALMHDLLRIPSEKNTIGTVEFTRLFLSLGNDAMEKKRQNMNKLKEKKRLETAMLERKMTRKNMFQSGSGSCPASHDENDGRPSSNSHNLRCTSPGSPLATVSYSTNSHKSLRMHSSSSTLLDDEVDNDTLLQSVLEKISTTALDWDNNSFIESVCTAGFECYLTPLEFKEQIRRSFGIRLTKREIGVLMEKYRVQKDPPPAELATSKLKTVNNSSSMSAASSVTYMSPSVIKNFKSRKTKLRQHHLRQLKLQQQQIEEFNDANGSFNTLAASSSLKRVNTSGAHCIDGHKFLKDFLSGTSIRKPGEAVLKQRREIYKQRKERVNKLGQTVDCLPKVLGR